ncbi:MocR-like pyridoxine biosynthesis transcription factor PdxR [Deinococcus cellulosilyticus]|uniref:GntR family transcriptional regulator n=1 Tax=Deinococcus cellulosilyticus (strain DSM 18568 / NBRC 106333 / KACC 11606 / 5516J-15) TaxID=1223518 RepID=A0A511N6U2_DEIC1|nr:PLP-dependent aminotransferase family protein [Deinococcus cellulosilyticus]GEM48564.1 GntR family transcriptional regulator [Deinococcus cellulosilyticus NBRC 106333 = KACC 11606]
MPRDLQLSLERHQKIPLGQQIREQLRNQILQGKLPAGMRLPSTRDLAQVYGVTRNTVIAAFEELLAEGLLVSRQGSGTFVNPEVTSRTAGMPAMQRSPRWMQKPPLELPVTRPIVEGTIEFRAGLPSLEALSKDDWKVLWRAVGQTAFPADYQDAQGELELREQVALFVRRSRGIACTAADVMITSGTIHALNLIAQVTLERGDQVAFEEPGFPLAREVFRHHEATVVPTEVDEDGLRVQSLPDDPPPVLIYTTPSHQFPLGYRMSLPRREALLHFAAQHDALIIEDDYESEFRFDAPLPALASMDHHGLVAYIGTLSKVLTPALRLGYIVAPPALIDRVKVLRQLTDYQHSHVLQTAMLELLRRGMLDRHIRSMRKVYAQKRQALKEALKETAGLCRLIGIDAGLHGFLQLPDHIPYREVQRQCAARKVLVEPPDRYYAQNVPLNGLMLGYGGLSLPQIQQGGKVLSEVILQCATENSS